MLKVLCSVLCVLVVVKEGGSEGIDEVLRTAGTDNEQHYDSTQHGVRFDSDMLFEQDDWDFIQKFGVQGKASKRDLERARRKGRIDRLWPNNTVYYEYGKGEKFDNFDRQIIQNAFDNYKEHTCLRFEPATVKIKRKIVFVNGTGCSSFVGTKAEKSQTVTLHKNCRVKGVVLHELAHAIGCFHEQTRPDRDTYITIHEENVVDGMMKNFQKFEDVVIPDLGVPYDYQSLMHYGSHDLSKNGKPTITTKDEYAQSKLGNRKGFTYFDLKTINLMYGCGKHCKPPKKKCEGYLDQNCNCLCEGYNLYAPTRVCDGTKIVKPGRKKGKGGSGKKRRKCKDKVGDCRKNYAFCRDPGWLDYMEENCSKTCGCRQPKTDDKKKEKTE